MAYSDRLSNKLKLLPKDSSDKQAYISFLEVQLDKAAQSANNVQGFTSRLDDFQSQLGMFEEKLLNLTRLLKAEHDCVESQEEGLEEVKKKVGLMGGEVMGLEGKMRAMEGKGKDLRLEELENRLGDIENKLQMGSINADTQEAKRIATYEAFVKAVEQALSDEEIRLNTAIKRTVETIEDKERNFRSQVENALEQHTRNISIEIRKLESRLQDPEPHRPKSPLRDPFPHFSQRLEVFFTQEIEGEMNGLRESMRFPTISYSDELKDVKEKAWNAEQICNRLAEDTLDRLTRMDQRISDLGHGKTDGNLAEIERKLQAKVENNMEKSADLLRKYLETQRNMQNQIKELGVALKRMEWMDSRPNVSVTSEKQGNEVQVSPRFPLEGKERRATSVPHQRRVSKSPKHRSASSSNTPPVRSPASPVHPSTAKSRAMDASIKKKLKDIKSREKSETKSIKTPERKQQRHKRLEERRNDRLDQLYREYTAKYQSAQV